jgi:hypothetical protein
MLPQRSGVYIGGRYPICGISLPKLHRSAGVRRPNLVRLLETRASGSGYKRRSGGIDCGDRGAESNHRISAARCPQGIRNQTLAALASPVTGPHPGTTLAYPIRVRSELVAAVVVVAAVTAPAVGLRSRPIRAPSASTSIRTRSRRRRPSRSRRPASTRAPYI